jgi:hypothetical protein
LRFELRADVEEFDEEVKNMQRFFANAIILPIWASPNSSVYDLLMSSSDMSAIRHARALTPGLPLEEPTPDAPVQPVRPLPTDIPVPDPHDIPLHTPEDVPPPDPGKNPKPVTPLPTRPDSKPRPTS